MLKYEKNKVYSNMPRLFYEDETTQQEQQEQHEFNVSMLTDEELEQLMERYKEKLQRYTVFLNEEFERTERKILIVHLEQVKRFRMKTNNNI
jgi:phosphoglycerol transferase MdoB-like AlkP superfamily enzyme